MATQSLQQQQAGFNAFKQNERMQPQVSALSGINGAPVPPDFSITNQFGGNPYTRVGGALGMIPGSGNPFGMSASAASASAMLPSFGGGGSSSALGGGGMGASINRLVASNDKLISAINKLTTALTSGTGLPTSGGAGGGAGGGGGGGGAGGAFGGKLGKLMNGLGIMQTVAEINPFTMGINMGRRAAAAQEAVYSFRSQTSLGISAANFGMSTMLEGMGGLGTEMRNARLAQLQARIRAGGRGANMLAEGLQDVATASKIPIFGSAKLALGRGRIEQGRSLMEREVADATRRFYESDEYKEEDRKLLRARRYAATVSATSVADYYQGLSRYPGGEGADAIYRGAAFGRRANQARVVSEIGERTMIPMERAALGHLGNVMTRADNFSRFTYSAGGRRGLSTGGFINGRIRNGLMGGQFEENFTDYTGVLGSALGVGNLEGANILQNVVSAQGFRGISGDIAAGYSAIANPNMTARQIRDTVIRQGVNRAFGREPRNMVGDIAGQNLGFSIAANPGSLSARLRATSMAGYSGISGNATMMAAAYQGQNITGNLSEVAAYKQAGFTDASIGAAFSVGRGGSNMGGFISGSSLLAEANFLGLRGGAAQQYIESRVGFGSGLAAQGINLAGGAPARGFTAGGESRFRTRVPRGQPTNLDAFVQPAFGDAGGDAGNQLLGEIATVVNRGRAAHLASFMGTNYGARAQELTSQSRSVMSTLRGMTGNFANDILTASLLAESGGSIAGAFRKGERLGPLGALQRLRAIGGNDRGFLEEGLVGLGYSSDTARMAIDSPMELQELMQKRQRGAPRLMSTTAAGIQAEVETQRAQRFDPVKFRTLKLTEMLKENSEASKLTLEQIYRFLRANFSSSKRRRRTPQPDPYNFEADYPDGLPTDSTP